MSFATSWHKRLLQRQHDLKSAGLWRRRRDIGSAQQAMVKSDGRWLANFSSNDYLGLASHPALIEASQDAAKQWGVGAGASHLVCGHQSVHEQLENALAEFVGAERALLFSNGYMANLALNTAFVEKGDLLLHDRLNHASLIDGALSSSAQFKRYAHLDCAHAQKRLLSTEFDRLMLVTDGVFSMDGDVAPLSALNTLACANGGLLCVDDAHGFGVLGAGGRGSLDQWSLRPTNNVILMGTLGKALGSYGAFVAGDAVFIEQLVQTARSYIYTTALPPHVAAASLAALQLVRDSHNEMSTRLNGSIALFKGVCGAANIELMPSDTPIQPVLVGDEQAAVLVSARLQELGFLVPAIRTPTVPKGAARLRVTLSAAHTEVQVEALVGALFDTLAQTVHR